jgi:hypothetical protein
MPFDGGATGSVCAPISSSVRGSSARPWTAKWEFWAAVRTPSFFLCWTTHFFRGARKGATI